MKPTLLAGVVALTLATASAAVSAAEPEAPTSAPAASLASALPTRPSRPLTFAAANAGTPVGYKLLVGVGVIAAAGLWLRKKRRTAQTSKQSNIEVLGRTSLGMRSELIVIDVEGTRLLVGMTPSGLNTLAVLETPGDAPETTYDAHETSGDEPPATSELGDRVRSLLAARQGAEARATQQPPAEATRERPRRVATAPRTASVAGQAKGLLLALEEPAPARDRVNPSRSRGW